MHCGTARLIPPQTHDALYRRTVVNIQEEPVNIIFHFVSEPIIVYYRKQVNVYYIVLNTFCDY